MQQFSFVLILNYVCEETIIFKKIFNFTDFKRYRIKGIKREMQENAVCHDILILKAYIIIKG